MSIDLTTEPDCCNEPMVHNSFTGEWECADAYFAIVDELDPEDKGQFFSPSRLRDDDVPLDMVAVLRHWRASRIPDGWASMEEVMPG